LGFPSLRLPTGSRFTILSSNLFPGILFTCPNYR
jgi:hypothetical protein